MIQAITNFVCLTETSQTLVIRDMVKKFEGALPNHRVQELLGGYHRYPEVLADLYSYPDRHAVARVLIHMAGAFHADLDHGAGALIHEIQKHAVYNLAFLSEDNQRFATMPFTDQKCFVDSYFDTLPHQDPDTSYNKGWARCSVSREPNKHVAWLSLTLDGGKAKAKVLSELAKYRDAHNMPFTAVTKESIKGEGLGS